MQRRIFTRRATAGAMVVALAFAGAACGDDDDDTGSGTGSGAEETTTTGEDAAGGDEQAWCDANFELSLAFNTEEGPDPAEAEEHLETLEADAPEELAEHTAVAAAAAREALAGDEEAFNTDEFDDAITAMDEYTFANCGVEGGEISTVDYGFVGIPSEVPAGRGIVQVTNEGDEIHEVVLLRKNDGVTESFVDIFTLGEEQALQMVTQAGFVFVGEAGEVEYLYADLEPGNYAAACFIPVGAVDFPTLETLGEDAPPHFTQGMVFEFTVA